MDSKFRVVAGALHVAGLASFAATFSFLNTTATPIGLAYGWYFQFLTILGILLSSITFTVGLLGDVSNSKAMLGAKNALSVPATAVEVLISILYWSISAYDRTLLAPPDMMIPLKEDIGMHLTPAIVLLLDFLLLSPPVNRTVTEAISTAGVIGVAYWFWVEHCYQQNGWYPYPFFSLMTPGQRLVLFVVSCSIAAGTIVVLSKISNRWSLHKKTA